MKLVTVDMHHFFKNNVLMRYETDYLDLFKYMNRKKGNQNRDFGLWTLVCKKSK